MIPDLQKNFSVWFICFYIQLSRYQYLCILPNKHLCQKHWKISIRVLWCVSVTIWSCSGKVTPFSIQCCIFTTHAKVEVLCANVIYCIWWGAMKQQFFIGISSVFAHFLLLAKNYIIYQFFFQVWTPCQSLNLATKVVLAILQNNKKWYLHPWNFFDICNLQKISYSKSKILLLHFLW